MFNSEIRGYTNLCRSALFPALKTLQSPQISTRINSVSVLINRYWQVRTEGEERILKKKSWSDLISYHLSTVYKLRPLLRPPSQLQPYFLPLANKHWLKWLFIIIQVRSEKNNIIRNLFSLNWPIKTGITVQWISTSNNFVLWKKSLTLSNS